MYIGVTITGVEDIAVLELKELNAKAEQVAPGRVKFSVKDIKEIDNFNKSLIRIYELLGEGECDSVEDIVKVANQIKYSFEGNFKAKCTRKGEHDFQSKEVEQFVGEAIYEKGFEVDLKNPKNLILIDIIDNKFFIGLLINKKDYHKREYKVKPHHHGINACLAYSMMRLANYSKDKVLLDPFCKDGVLAIETAMFATNLPRTFEANSSEIKTKIYAIDEQMGNVRSAETNSKLADVNKLITFSRLPLDDLDKKLKENEVDCIVTLLPSPSKTFSEKRSLKIYEELFYQMDYIMKKNFVGVFLLYDSKLFKKKNKYKIKEERKVLVGSLGLDLIIVVPKK